jgi:uncharacterized membrane protein
MDEQPIREVPPAAAPAGAAGWTETPATSYTPANGYTQAPPPPAAAAAGDGLSDNAAGALAYVTIIPAILFLVLAPYNTRPFVKFHAFQCLGLAVVWFCIGIIGIIPILGWLVFALGSLVMLVTWVLCIIKASQGSALKLPVIGEFASKQSGYNPR